MKKRFPQPLNLSHEQKLMDCSTSRSDIEPGNDGTDELERGGLSSSKSSWPVLLGTVKPHDSGFVSPTILRRFSISESA